MKEVIRRKANGERKVINSNTIGTIETKGKASTKAKGQAMKKQEKAQAKGQAKEVKTILDIYQNQFKRLRTKQAQVIDSKQWDNEDIIQETIIKLLAYEQGQAIEIPEHLFNMVRKQCFLNCLEKKRKGESIDKETQEVSAFVEFDSSISDIAMDNLLSNDEKRLHEETIEYIADMMKSELERKLFIGYYVNGSTVRELAEETGLDKMKVNRLLEKIKTRILNKCQVSDLFDSRYILPDHAETMPTMPCFKAEKECPDQGKHIDQSEYRPQVKLSHHAEKPLDNLDIETPTKAQECFDTYEYIAFDFGHALEYRKLSYRNNTLTGESLNPYGSMYRLNKVDNMPYALSSKPYRASAYLQENRKAISAFGQAELAYMWT